MLTPSLTPLPGVAWLEHQQDAFAFEAFVRKIDTSTGKTSNTAHSCIAMSVGGWLRCSQPKQG